VFPQGISLFPYLNRLNTTPIISNYGNSKARKAKLLLIAVRIAIVVDVTVPIRSVRINVAIIIRVRVKAGQRTVNVIGVNRAIYTSYIRISPYKLYILFFIENIPNLILYFSNQTPLT